MSEVGGCGMSEHLRTDLVLEAQKKCACTLCISNDDSTEYSSLESKSEEAVAAPASGYVCIPGSVVCVPACESRAGQQYRICYFSMRNN